jgi:hypothetical protein
VGLKFCDAQNRDNQLVAETEFENLMSQLWDLSSVSEDDVGALKAKLVDSCFQYRRCRPSGHRLIKRKHREALRELRMNNNVLLARPDKGAGVVLLDRNDYNHKLESILSDHSKFQRLSGNKDTTEKIEKQLSTLLNNLLATNAIDSQLHSQLKPTGSSISRMYGLPKIHKPGVPLRPILDMSNSPYHLLSKWLAEKLQPIRERLSVNSTRDSFDFVDRVKDLNITNKSMVSFDVTSLFTNVPVLETVDFLCDYITTEGLDVGISRNLLKEAILRCTLDVSFQFNGNIYRQIDGVAMGSCLGPLLADVFMSKIESGTLSNRTDQLDVYVRYVDDIFITCSTEVNVEQLLEQFNTAHHAINFTMEEESGGQLPFLDVLLCRREDGTIERRVHRKPTWNGQYIHFYSFVPLKRKRNLIKNLAFRARKICSPDTIEQELCFLRNVFLKNGYPEQFISKNMKEQQARLSVQTAQKKNIYLRIDYKGETVSENLTFQVRKAVEMAYPAAKMQFIFTNRPLLKSVLKDRLPSSTSSYVLYQYQCSQCSASYIGRTTRRLSNRIKEHCPSWLGKGVTRQIRSSVLAHLVDTGHPVNKEADFTVIYRAPFSCSRWLRQRSLNIAEAVAIRLHNPPLCVQKQLAHPLLLPWPSCHNTQWFTFR